MSKSKKSKTMSKAKSQVTASTVTAITATLSGSGNTINWSYSPFPVPAGEYINLIQVQSSPNGTFLTGDISTFNLWQSDHALDGNYRTSYTWNDPNEFPAYSKTGFYHIRLVVVTLSSSNSLDQQITISNQITLTLG